MRRRHDQILSIWTTEGQKSLLLKLSPVRCVAQPNEARWLTAELTNSYTVPLNEPGYALSTPESFAKIYLPTSLLSLPLGVSVAVSGQLPTASSTSLNTPTGQQWYPRQTGLIETVRKWVREDVDLWINQAIIPHHTSQGNSLEECGAVVDARTT